MRATELRFTRLRLNGFKSFVDPTDLVIHDGLTGVVGPNGCGKSNLLEALRWVMGENRPSAMRGGGMEDVIFNGAATRGARHYAEVALVLDNSERLAPSGFNDADTLEITRRITRDAGSAYKLNTRDVRARDVQMLFADASTGSHSPALVRQGQISELINAKPKARRVILEEAAGISGLYARRHEAELKLAGAEQNLLRVDDVIEGLAQQLSALTRQAKQAARYREIGEDLRRAEGQLLYRRWREADLARAEAEAHLRQRLTEAARTEAAARAAARASASAEDALPPLRDEAAIAAAILQRLTVQRDQLGDQEARARGLIETLRGRIAELDRDAERESGLNRDAGEVIARLEWEIGQLLRGQDGHDDRLADAAEAARTASASLTAGETGLADATEDAARLAARHQSVQRLLAEARAGLTRAEAEATRAVEAATGAETAQAGGGRGLCRRDRGARSRRHAGRKRRRRADRHRDGPCRGPGPRGRRKGRPLCRRRRGGRPARRSHRAGPAGRARRPGRASAAGSVAGRTRAGNGHGCSPCRRSARPRRGRRPALGLGGPARLCRATAAAGRGRAAGRPCQGPAVLARRLAQIGLVGREDGAALQAALGPGQRLVSREGDLWRWDGFRAAAEDAPSAAALRLQQLNRLTRLKRDLEEVAARATGAAQAHGLLQARLADLARADQLARDARRAADLRVTEMGRAAARAEADASIASGRRDAARLAVARHQDEAGEARARLEEARAAEDDLPDLDAARAAVDAARLAVESARAAMLARRADHDELRREGEARVRRRQEAVKELSGWRHRLETAGKRIAELALRRAETVEELAEANAAPEDIAIKREELGEAIAEAEARRSAASENLAAGETALRSARVVEREAERLASEAREARARAEARSEAARETVAHAAERIAEEAGATPEQLLGTLKVDPDRMADAETLDSDVQRLKRQRDALGAVNLRAEEDARAVSAEYDTLVQEKLDLEAAIKKLRAGIAGLNREGRERLLTAFEQVNGNFSALFTHLFGGGEARLVLVESDDPLEAGLEIMCQPPGKRLATLSLLSGGEQTLTALALIFGVFLANPAPICVLDEVDAPLDDANVTRFCDLLDEMTRRTDTRFLIITHHAVTMARMDRLFGVTMAEQGVSQLVSVDLKRAAALVA